MRSITIPGFGRTLDNHRTVSFGPPPEIKLALAWAIREGHAFLNGPEHPIPVFDFWCYAPDVATHGTAEPTASLILNGKRAGRIYYNEACEFVRNEVFETPEEFKDGEAILWPQTESPE